MAETHSSPVRIDWGLESPCNYENLRRKQWGCWSIGLIGLFGAGGIGYMIWEGLSRGFTLIH